MDKWIEVDLSTLKQNVQTLQAFFNVPIMAVIKQNAYGLGAVKIGNYMEQLGIRFFAVTHIQEGIELRNGGIKSPILILAPAYQNTGDLQDLWDYALTPSVYSSDFAETLNELTLEKRKPIGVHLKVDTGMGRMGFTPDEMLVKAEWLKNLKGLTFEGIFTHYSNPFEKRMEYTKRQKDIFINLTEQLERMGLTIPVKYSASSLAALRFPDTHMDMVSIGSAFLGNSIINPAVPLRKVYRCKVRVLQVKTLTKGSCVGYSNTYVTKKDTNIAVLPIGYTDGFGLEKQIDSFRLIDFFRELYQLMKQFINPGNSIFFKGNSLKVIGKTSMQLTVVEVGDHPVHSGDIVDVELNPLLVSARIERVYVVEPQLAALA